MRINPNSTDSLLWALNAATGAEREGLSQLASGKRIDVPSDDPAAMALLLQNSSRASANTTYSENCKALQSMLQTADSALSSATTVLTRAITLGVEGASGTQSAANRKAIAGELRGIRDQLLSAVNVTFRGSYLFAGTATDMPAFSELADGSIQYNGNSETSYARIGETRTLAMNVPGDRLFDAGGMSSFEALGSMIAGLESNDGTAVEAATSNLRRAFDQLSSERVFYGNTISRLESNESQLAAEDLEFSAEEERLSGADLAKTLTDLSQAQTAIQAILTASGKISKLSLFDFLQ